VVLAEEAKLPTQYKPYPKVEYRVVKFLIRKPHSLI